MSYKLPWSLTDMELQNLIEELDDTCRREQPTVTVNGLPSASCLGCGEAKDQPHKSICCITQVFGVINTYRAMRKETPTEHDERIIRNAYRRAGLSSSATCEHCERVALWNGPYCIEHTLQYLEGPC